MISILLGSLLLIMAMMVGLWLISLAAQDVSIVDPFWGTGFVIVTWFAFASISRENVVERTWLLASLITIWGTRLSLYLLWRNWGHEEDRRYRAMREYHGERFLWISLGTVFLLQAVILWVVSMPIQVTFVNGAHNQLGGLDWFGVGLWSIGLFFETVGDYQMARFQADPGNVGRVMDQGLWRLTRHPNYFGDFCVWWGIYSIALAGSAGWTIFSPLLMSLLLLKVSGVSLLEKNIVHRRPEYLAYQKRTSSFFPWLPKNI